MPHPDSTTEAVTTRETTRLARAASRGFVLLLLLVCIAGGVGLLGGHTATAAASGGGYRLTLDYPGTTRPGLDAFWQLSIHHPGGFRHPVTVAITASYFELFETQGFYPTPSDTTRDAEFVYLTFTPPPSGDTLKVLYDSYVQPYVAPTNLFANDATVAVVVHKEQVAAIHATTWVLP